jgi:hypothetical protein
MLGHRSEARSAQRQARLCADTASLCADGFFGVSYRFPSFQNAREITTTLSLTGGMMMMSLACTLPVFLTVFLPSVPTVIALSLSDGAAQPG